MADLTSALQQASALHRRRQMPVLELTNALECLLKAFALRHLAAVGILDRELLTCLLLLRSLGRKRRNGTEPQVCRFSLHHSSTQILLPSSAA